MPHTTIVLKSFDVKYIVPGDNESNNLLSENGVKSDRLRIIADEKDLEPAEANEAAVVAAAPQVDQVTGIGGWQTVTVREVDEVKEREEYEKAVEAIRKGEYKVRLVVFFNKELITNLREPLNCRMRRKK